ncbi:MAG: hypothetical protein MK289_03210 [Trichodesmium sp. ALOHA_ZT_67]|uniref:hypothetical protein n=1 Tax=Trichodesmium erythraeum TaxID=1206 RepID=UPI00032233B0|nr:hypothetical protein [Trichodesmium erythraeum GBRTRLIN201]MCH2047525.1 hypothetical protein [Trichodesmium sp. ALOHA_ZT_67]MDE5096485.1 hypothetical protein [Trichodesmium sp. St11_bin5]
MEQPLPAVCAMKDLLYLSQRSLLAIFLNESCLTTRDIRHFGKKYYVTRFF